MGSGFSTGVVEGDRWEAMVHGLGQCCINPW